MILGWLHDHNLTFGSFFEMPGSKNLCKILTKNFEKFKRKMMILKYLWCSTSLPGGNQVDGLPPAASQEKGAVFRRFSNFSSYSTHFSDFSSLDLMFAEAHARGFAPLWALARGNSDLKFAFSGSKKWQKNEKIENSKIASESF